MCGSSSLKRALSNSLCKCIHRMVSERGEEEELGEGEGKRRGWEKGRGRDGKRGRGGIGRGGEGGRGGVREGRRVRGSVWIEEVNK